tara:strand:+ start:349 stop:633 length:285 start_codon:yes stop_codon:yes gene_type:complete
MPRAVDLKAHLEMGTIPPAGHSADGRQFLHHLRSIADKSVLLGSKAPRLIGEGCAGSNLLIESDCPGQIKAKRDGDRIRWHCTECEARGTIKNW